MPPSQDPIDKMSSADKLLRVGTFGGLALLLLVVTIQSFREGAPRDPAQQVADAPEAEESVDMASAEAEEDASDDTEMAAEEPATEAPVETTETAEVAPMAEEPAAEVETAEAETGATDDATETAEADTTAEDASESTEAAAPEDDTTETEVAQADAPAAEAETVNWLADSPLLASADLAAGESAFRQCSACHQYATERNGGGPHLVGIVGRDMAAVDDWRYSNALLEQDGIWTPEKLNEWLINPDDYIPGNRMAYPGVRDEQERINIIGFLASQNQ